MNWIEILSIEWSQPAGIKIDIGPIALCAGGIWLVVWLALHFFKYKLGDWEVVEAQINIGQIGHVKIHRNPEVMRIAHQAWTELQTRKAALPFDEDHDVIIEIYDSWYALFGEFRRLIKTVPSEKIKANQDTEKLVNIMVAVLNQGLRPHLTRWQSRFRAWWQKQPASAVDVHPQDVQKTFPQYAALIADLKIVNAELQKYADFLKRLAHGE